MRSEYWIKSPDNYSETRQKLSDKLSTIKIPIFWNKIKTQIGFNKYVGNILLFLRMIIILQMVSLKAPTIFDSVIIRLMWDRGRVYGWRGELHLWTRDTCHVPREYTDGEERILETRAGAGVTALLLTVLSASYDYWWWTITTVFLEKAHSFDQCVELFILDPADWAV